MCNISGIIFGAKTLKPDEVKGKKLIEVGSLDVNGSLRPILESWQPAKYVGIDIVKGSGVDQICRVEEMVKTFGKEKFDLVITTELLEHVRDWRQAISNLKQVCQKKGIILITTRSIGRRYHGFPHDYWRYEKKDMEKIFADCEIIALEKDREEPGIFVKVRKPADFQEKDLSTYKLYSIVTDQRMINLAEKDFQTFYFFKQQFKNNLRQFVRQKPILRSFLEKVSSLVN